MFRLSRASKKTTLALLVVMGAAFMMPACGDDDDDGGGSAVAGSVDTGVPEDKTLSELDEGDKDAICDTIDGLVGPEVECFGAALLIALFSEDVAACQATFDACIDDPEQFAEESDFDFGEGACSVENIPEDCNATVGELEACISEQNDAIQSLLDNFDCAEVLDSDGSDEGPGPACQAVEEKCPGFLDDGGDDFDDFNNDSNNGEGFSFIGSGSGCGGDTMAFEADIIGEATSVEVEVYIGDETELHPLTLNNEGDGGQSWSVALDTNGTFEAGTSTAFSCDQFGEIETITRASGPDGDICSDSGGPRSCP